MNTADILNAAVAAQNLASNPAHSTWVSANAGSGKTRVLTDRVARLLLAGADPQKILCLTFTKAAAAEMQSRLYRRLGAWSMLDDPALRGELAAIGETVYDDGALRRARTLFAAALETPGGLKIQTIHAFCAHLLRRFPLEAGVSPDFREMEDRAAALLRAEVVDALIAEGDTSFDAFALHLGNEGGLDRVYLDILKHRDGFAGFDRDAVAAAFGVDPAETPDTVRARALARISIANAVAIAENFAALGGANAQKKLPALKAFVTAPEGHRDLRHLVAAFFDAKGTNPLKTQGHLVTKAMREAFPAIDDYIHDIQDIVAEARAKQRGLHALAKSEALHRFAGAFLAAYEAAKSRRGLLDFDDLIDRARDLLTVSSMAQWVLYRLDGGIDHILVDEAQDTAPRQWAVVKALTAEFIATGPDARKRTIFVVGDKKQSIFGFQGDPGGPAPRQGLSRRRGYARHPATIPPRPPDRSAGRNPNAACGRASAHRSGPQFGRHQRPQAAAARPARCPHSRPDAPRSAPDAADPSIHPDPETRRGHVLPRCPNPARGTTTARHRLPWRGHR